MSSWASFFCLEAVSLQRTKISHGGTEARRTTDEEKPQRHRDTENGERERTGNRPDGHENEDENEDENENGQIREHARGDERARCRAPPSDREIIARILPLTDRGDGGPRGFTC